MSTTYDPNEAFAEDGQQNDIESSHDPDKTQVSVTKDDSEEMSATFDVSDQENTQTSVTKEDSEEMSETFDVSDMDTSTLVNTQRKEETENTTSTGDEEKTETADPSGDNDDSCEEDNNEEEQKDEYIVEGKGEEGIEDGTKDSNEVGNDNDNKDDKSAEGDDEKVISDVTKVSPHETTADVNTTTNENANNSDDIIPSENTHPEAESVSITISNIEMGQSEVINKCAATEIVQLSAMDSTDMTNTQNTEDGTKPAIKHRLGMRGPAFTKRTVQVKMQDISIDSDKGSPKAVTKQMKGGQKSVMRKLMCMKCLEMFFMMEGYQRHLFKDHKVRCFDNYLPQVIEKIVMRYSEETYETNYRVMHTKDSDKGGQLVTNSDKTSPETNIAEEANAKNAVEENVNVNTEFVDEPNTNENDESSENRDISSDGKLRKPTRRRKCKVKKSQLTSRKKKTVSGKGKEEESEAYKKLRLALQNVYSINREEPTVKCISCETYLYSEDGMRTHFQHAHTNLNDKDVGDKNEPQTDAKLNDELAVETQNDLSQDNERETIPTAEHTEQSELPDIVPSTQTITHGRKRT